MTATLEIVGTGEVIEAMTAEEASSITTQIAVKLDAIADNYTSVMPLIRDAITRQAHVALGYPSAGAYAADRFGSALSRLSPDLRRQVVKELSEAGMSTRAIAPVVGVNNATVYRDLAGVASATPVPALASPAEALVNRATGEVLVDAEDMAKIADYDSVTEERFEAGLTAAREQGDLSHENVIANIAGSTSSTTPVTGLDGKTYSRESASASKRRRPITDDADKVGWDLRRATDRLAKLVADDRLRANEEQVTQLLRGHLLYVSETVAAVLGQLPSTSGA